MPCAAPVMCLLVSALLAAGTGLAAAGAEENRSAAWQTRDQGEWIVEPSPALDGRGRRSAALQWQTARNYRRPTASVPRGPDDPFHDPFGDRRHKGHPAPPPSHAEVTANVETSEAAAPLAIDPVRTDNQSEPSAEIRLVVHESADGHEPEPTPADPRPEDSDECGEPGPFLRTPVPDRPAPTRFHITPPETGAVRVAAGSARAENRRTPPATRSARDKGHRAAPFFSRQDPPIRLRTAARDPLPPMPPSPGAHPLSGQATKTPRRADTKFHSKDPHLRSGGEGKARGSSGSRIGSKFQISDPAMTTVQPAQFEQPSDEDSQSEQLEDLFAPREESPPPSDPPLDAPPPELQDEADFNRPFDVESQVPAEEENGEGVPGERNGDTEEDLDALLPPESPFQPEDNASDCKEIYNDRNCCDEATECRERIEMLRTKTLREVSTDISPPFDPLAETPELSQQRQEDRLAMAPSRTWFDQHGRRLAEGKLVDISNAEVIIQQADGQLVPISGLLLGRDERCFISAWWNLPNDCIPAEEPFPIRDFTMTTFTWTASALCHRPLYFEDVQTERYGHSAGPILQTFMSGAHFYSSIALLPYNMGLYPPKECMYALGYYRPGNCAPWLVSAFPISKRAILAEATAIFALYGFLH